MDTKICSNCNKKYPTSEHKSYWRTKCKECYSIYRKPFAAKYREKLLPKDTVERKSFYKKKYKTYKETHRNRYIRIKDTEKYKKWQKENSSNYYKNNKEGYRRREKERNARPEVKKRSSEIHAERMKSDIQYVLKRRLRFRLRNAIKAIGKSIKYKSSISLLGCDIDDFKRHIESLFLKGMDWDGVLTGKINIDHKVPCVVFDLSDIEQQKKCFHYSNLQPMWQKDNYSKGGVHNGVDYRLAVREDKRKKKKLENMLVA